MNVAAIIAVAVLAIVLWEFLGHADPHTTFLFALLDRFVSDESPLEMPDAPPENTPTSLVSRRAA